MPEIHLKVGFIGAGNMGQAMIGALLTSETCDPSNIYICDILSEQTDYLKKTYNINVLNKNRDILETCDVIVFAVKPQSIEQVLVDLKATDIFKEISERKIFISIAAGTPIKKFEAFIYQDTDVERKSRMPILRVMPNTPALVLSGMSGVCANDFARKEDILITKKILTAMGNVIECRETDMDAVTAVSGSGPAYCFYLAEAIIDAAVELGLSAESALEMTTATLKGAIALMESQSLSPEELRRKVTSPGGTTEAAIKVLDDHAVKQTIIQAVIAAAERSKELST